MKKLLAAGIVAATFWLTACSGQQSLTPPAPTAPIAPDASAAQAAQTTVGLAPAAAAAPAATGTASLPGFADGNAYAEYTTRTSGKQTEIVSGPLGEAPLACGSNAGTGTSTLPALRSPYAVSRGTAVQNWTSTADGTKGTVVSTSTISGLSILKGVIRARSVKAVAQSTATATSGTSDASGSSFKGLVVEGKPVVSPKANSTIYLKNYGYVVLDGVTGPVDNKKNPNGSMQTNVLVEMIRVVINIANNPLKIPVGTTIVVGSAYSSFTIPPAPYVVNPTAYSLLATGYGNNAANESGPWTAAGVACNANASRNAAPGATTPVGTIGSTADSANATTTANATSATSSSATASASLLNGLIVGKSIQVSSTVNRKGTAFTSSGTMKFASLSIDGKTIAPNVAANTKIVMPGLGFIMVNEQSIIPAKDGYTEEVNAVHLYVTAKGNKYGIAKGGQVVLGHAHAQISHT